MAVRIAEFDIWRPGYAGATVEVFAAGTTTPLAIFADEALTTALSNPQTLITVNVDNQLFGKFAQPVYVGAPYQLRVNSVDGTGIVRPPLVGLSGEDASAALVRASGGSVDVTLAAVLARQVYASDYGEMGSSAATNAATLTAAIGAATGMGGGNVLLPSGTYGVTQLSIPGGVVLVGNGTTLTSQVQDKAFQITGESGGFRNITLDGVDRQPSSFGIWAQSILNPILHELTVRRFDVGIHWEGASRARAFGLSVINNRVGYELHGDTDAGGTGLGGGINGFTVFGGRIEQNTEIALEALNEDASVTLLHLSGVSIRDNTGVGIKSRGAFGLLLDSCDLKNNITPLDIDDGPNADADFGIGISRRITLSHCILKSGDINVEGTARDIELRNCDLADITFNIGPISGTVLLADCAEDDGVTVTGAGAVRLVRQKRVEMGAAAIGRTSDATPITAYSVTLGAGESAVLEVSAVANAVNAVEHGEYWGMGRAFYRPGDLLGYDTKTVAFTLGQIVTGATSAATGIIVDDTDGTAGTLTLRNVQGVFQNNEIITGALGGTALATGANAAQAITALGTLVAGTVVETTASMAVEFVLNSPDVDVRVTGIDAITLDWLVNVRQTRLA